MKLKGLIQSEQFNRQAILCQMSKQECLLQGRDYPTYCLKETEKTTVEQAIAIATQLKANDATEEYHNFNQMVVDKLARLYNQKINVRIL